MKKYIYKYKCFLLIISLVFSSSFLPFALADCPSSDFNSDCRIDFEDFVVLAENWLVVYDLSDLDALAFQWLDEETTKPNIIWVDINDPGISEHEGFLGQISKYETTNLQYCKFLNDALSTGDIYIDSNYAKGANGSDSGKDYVEQMYYNLSGSGYTFDGALNGGTARISYIDGTFIVDSGFENHPVTYVSWYGSTAFCNYYSWHLPTEWQWQAVADYDGSFIYGCGTIIDNNMANCIGSTHPDGTTDVGEFGTYGYGVADMAGNVWEWTSSLYDPQDSYRVICDGDWAISCGRSTVSFHKSNEPYYSTYNGGFRVFCYPFTAPDVLGITQEKAEIKIINAGMKIGTISEEYSDIVAYGNIISQNPSSNENVSSEVINLVVSLGQIPDITWVDINDPGVSGHEAFVGQISKYETTNLQYCKFLNDALDTGDIYVNGSYVKGDNGSNSGDDFVGQVYYDLNGQGYTASVVTNGGAARINYTDGLFTVDSGFENHPVTFVSWYGATAFCSYYHWRLPDEWQWQAVADYDGSYTYGCGITIDHNIANYLGSTHPNGTTVVGDFGTYGHGVCDMAGNVSEWTGSISTSYPTKSIIRGGSWRDNESLCNVSSYYDCYPNLLNYNTGFRVCPDVEPIKPRITWVYIDDSGEGMKDQDGFLGQISKYETTNAQYCHFLNQAITTDDIYVDSNNVYGNSGSNHGEDFQDQIYYNLAGPGYTYDGATNGGAARISYIDNVFLVNSGFEDHPITHVSWYGSKAFVSYYGWQLPTEWQWQAVADYDETFTYGCGTTIDHNTANYEGSTHPDGTTEVGAFGTYGYWMADMTGNISEWTDSCYYENCEPNERVFRGGCWYDNDNNCEVTNRGSSDPNYIDCNIGFRLCAENIKETIVPNVTGMNQEDAESMIISAGLIIENISQVYTDTVLSGKIISQSRSGGESIPLGARITLVVSAGPQPQEPFDIEWVYITDPGVPEHESFIGYMSKYEITNTQFAEFLNAACATGDAYFEEYYVFGANGSNSGEDFVDNYYYFLEGYSVSYYGAINGGASRINYSNGTFTVDPGFENHPVTQVSWYGAMAFADYYGWRLPTEWEWQAVADYDGTFIYCYGPTLILRNLNYMGSMHLYGTTLVGSHGTYGYGLCDMAGNVWEWTANRYCLRGGAWNCDFSFCKASSRKITTQSHGRFDIGFRVCR